RNSVDHATMRDMNLALILDVLRSDAPISRAELASRTGLNKATVSSIVRTLLEHGWVKELGVNSELAEVGRPGINLAPDPDAGYFIGAEINVDFISIIITNFAVEIVSRRFESSGMLKNQQAVLDRFLFLLAESEQQVRKSGHDLFGIGIGVPGLVDVSSGRLLFAPNLDWRDVPLRDLVQAQIDTPVYVMNEANQAALGELFFGAGRDSDFMLYVSAGIGIGGGIISNGRLGEGATGFAGEVGHMTVVRDGLPCNCGNHGCWETEAGLRALCRRIEEQVSAGCSTWLLEASGGDLDKLDISLVVQAAQRGDEAALQALHETADWLGIGMAGLVNVLNPQRVVFGGPLSLAHEFVLPAIRATVNRRAWDWTRDQAEIVLASHGRDAAVFGGVASIYRELLNSPRSWLERGDQALSSRRAMAGKRSLL
ncbi:MAG: ROK family transcriptional regulator, partial [Chloroflexota bacterium]